MAKKPIIRVGIAGQGRSGYSIHAAWLKQAPKKYKIVAVSDPNPEMRAGAVKEFGCRVYRDYPGLIQDQEVELFINALPNLLHPQGTIDALKGGKHVVCEKPLAIKVKDFDKMVATAKKSRRVLAPFQNSRFHAAFEKVQEVIASGKLGEIVYIRINSSNFSRRWDWQTLQEYWGGNLNNTGPHLMDQAVVLFGNRAPQVHCRMGSFNPWGDADNFCAVRLYGKNAPVIDVQLSSFQAYPQGPMYHVEGTQGGLAGGVNELNWRYFNPRQAPGHSQRGKWVQNRAYCKEELKWKEESWTLPKSLSGDYRSRRFYDNVYDVLVNKGKLLITLPEVRRQITAIEECHRQNRLPRMKKKFSRK